MERKPIEPDIIGDVTRPPDEKYDPTGLENFGPGSGSQRAIGAAYPKTGE